MLKNIPDEGVNEEHEEHVHVTSPASSGGFTPEQKIVEW